jgi:hypothetical protein
MKIYFDGCSWTYGTELENPEQERWSTLISQKLNFYQCKARRWE